jgi:hypothetical protein
LALLFLVLGAWFLVWVERVIDQNEVGAFMRYRSLQLSL